MHASGELDKAFEADLLETVGEIIAEAEVAALDREKGFAVRLDALSEKGEVAALRADLDELRARAVSDRGEAGAAIVAAVERLEEKFRLREREIEVELDARIRELAAPALVVAELKASIDELVTAAAEGKESLAAAVKAIELQVVDRISIQVREWRVEIEERFHSLRASVKDGAPGERGPAGPAGPGFVMRGTFDEAAVYSAGDAVVSKGSTFVALVDAPGPIPGDGWQIAAQRGKAGERGPAGEKGAPGPDGRPGPPGAQWKAGAFEEAGLVLEREDGELLTVRFPDWLLAVRNAFEVVS